MQMLQRFSVWGLIVGWLIVAVAAKTIRSDVAGLWLRIDLTLAIGVGVLLVSSIGAGLAIFSDRVTAADERQPPRYDTRSD
jgi:hypothetical protein